MVEQTREQLRASNPKSSVWVGASAGTGKTFVLSNRVLRLMLAGNRPDKILCLTYTNTAAAEMAIRVNSRLSEWISLSDDALHQELSDVLGARPSKDQMILARKLFAQVLDVPGGLKIQTIHSFCQSLLGRFPIEANVSPNFDLLDDITINEHLRKSQDDMLQKIDKGNNDELRDALNYLSGMLAEDTFSQLMKGLTNERGGLELLIKRNSSSFDQLKERLKELLGFADRETRSSILDVACDESNFDYAALKNTAEKLLTGTKTDIKKGEIISGWLNVKDDRGETFDHYKKAYLTAKDEFFAKFMTKKLGEEFPNCLDALYQEAERVKFVVERLKAYKLYENSVSILRLGFELIGTYNKRKRSRNVVDYDDLIGKVSALFKSVSASWILFKLDEGIDHILIDEAQDTNPEQWYVIRKIAQEFFTGLGTRDQDSQEDNPRTIFAVGDVKQSIYSFQKAKPKEFEDNKEYFAKQSAEVGLDFAEVPMNLSFRSTSAVLNVVDKVFDPEDYR
ncbi:MAG: UvrD-helicase domain-containing protein, partial [Emcibacteraceae bacterium]|nr:UvrD-helicase domain-containing protein [Emcibacteraceae bacterium]